MTMRWLHTWKVAEDTGETKAGFTDPDLTEIRSESLDTQSSFETACFTDRCFARFSLEKRRCKNGFFVW